MGKTGVVSLLIIVAVVSTLLYLNRKDPPVDAEYTAVSETQPSNNLDTPEIVEVDEDTSFVQYAPYTKEVLEQSSDTRRVLFFYASWCPTCRPADADFTQNSSQLPDDVTVIRVNYNDPETDQEERDLARQYGVTYQHTFVQIDSEGNEVTKWNGGMLNDLLENIK